MTAVSFFLSAFIFSKLICGEDSRKVILLWLVLSPLSITYTLFLLSLGNAALPKIISTIGCGGAVISLAFVCFSERVWLRFDKKRIIQLSATALACGFFYILIRNIPPYTGDGLMYHWPEAVSMVRQGDFNILKSYDVSLSWFNTLWDFYPKGLTYQYAIASFSAYTSPHGFVHIFTLFTFSLFLLYSSRDRYSSYGAVILLLTTPCFVLGIPTTIIDIDCGAYAAVVLIAAQEFYQSEDRTWLFILFISVAVYISSKLTVMLLVLSMGICSFLYLCCLCFSKQKAAIIKWVGLSFQIGLVSILGMIFGAIPWCVRNYLNSNSIFYPFNVISASYSEIYSTSLLNWFFLNFLHESPSLWSGWQLFNYEVGLGFLLGAVLLTILVRYAQRSFPKAVVLFAVFACVIMGGYLAIVYQRNFLITQRYFFVVPFIVAYWVALIGFVKNIRILTIFIGCGALNLLWSLPTLGVYVDYPDYSGGIIELVSAEHPQNVFGAELIYPDRDIMEKVRKEIKDKNVKISVVNYPFFYEVMRGQQGIEFCLPSQNDYNDFFAVIQQSDYFLYYNPKGHYLPEVKALASNGRIYAEVFVRSAGIYPIVTLRFNTAKGQIEKGDRLLVEGRGLSDENSKVFLYLDERASPFLLDGEVVELRGVKPKLFEQLYLSIMLTPKNKLAGRYVIEDLKLTLLKPDGTERDILPWGDVEEVFLPDIWSGYLSKMGKLKLLIKGDVLRFYELSALGG